MGDMANIRVSLLLRDVDDPQTDQYVVVADGAYVGWFERDKGENDWQCWSENGDDLGLKRNFIDAGNCISRHAQARERVN